MEDDQQKSQQTTEVQETNRVDPAGGSVTKQTVTTTDQSPSTAPSSVIAERLVYYLGGAIMLLLLVRFVLALLGANRDNPFAVFVFDVSGVFAWPFFGLFNYEPAYGASVFELGTVVAILVYAILTVGIAKLFGLARRTA